MPNLNNAIGRVVRDGDPASIINTKLVQAVQQLVDDLCAKLKRTSEELGKREKHSFPMARCEACERGIWVLEWEPNHEPFLRHHYGAGPGQTTLDVVKFHHSYLGASSGSTHSHVRFDEQRHRIDAARHFARDVFLGKGYDRWAAKQVDHFRRNYRAKW